MKHIKISFEVEDNTDIQSFEDCLLSAMDNWNGTELDKCSSIKVIEVIE